MASLALPSKLISTCFSLRPVGHRRRQRGVWQSLNRDLRFRQARPEQFQGLIDHRIDFQRLAIDRRRAREFEKMADNAFQVCDFFGDDFQFAVQFALARAVS